MKAVGPDDRPLEVWKCLGEVAEEFLTWTFNKILESKRMTEVMEKCAGSDS